MFCRYNPYSTGKENLWAVDMYPVSPQTPPMYAAHYALKEDPFRLSPDPTFVYRHSAFEECKSFVRNALVSDESTVVVTAFPGMGKTMLINDLLTEFVAPGYQLATLVFTRFDATEILRAAALEFGVEVEGMDAKAMHQRLLQHFMACRSRHCQALLVVDEAQNLSLEALDALQRLATSYQDGTPLLKLLLVGQNQLREKLLPERFRQLLACPSTHLQPLTPEETAAYITHRLKTAGWTGNPRIERAVIPVIHSISRGIPRPINQFCSRLLLLGAMESKTELHEKDARAVCDDVSAELLWACKPSTDDVVYEEFARASGDDYLGGRAEVSPQGKRGVLPANESVTDSTQVVEATPVLLTDAQIVAEQKAEATQPSRVNSEQHSSHSNEPQWLDVASWAAATQRMSHARQVPVPSSRENPFEQRSLPGDGALQERGNPQPLTVRDDNRDTVATLLMAIAALTGLAALAIFHL
jgi:general secretion pathway protein A